MERAVVEARAAAVERRQRGDLVLMLPSVGAAGGGGGGGGDNADGEPCGGAVDGGCSGRGCPRARLMGHV